MKIHPLFVMTAPVIVMVSCAQYGNERPAATTVADLEVPAPTVSSVASGRKLFLKNCAVCHAADAHGDDGPDLHDIGWTDDEIASRIRKGKAGQMTSFAAKLKPEEIRALVAYVQSLK